MPGTRVLSIGQQPGGERLVLNSELLHEMLNAIHNITQHLRIIVVMYKRCPCDQEMTLYYS